MSWLSRTCTKCELPATHGKLCSAHRMRARRSSDAWLTRQGRPPTGRRYATTEQLVYIWAARHVGKLTDSAIARNVGMTRPAVNKILNKRRHARAGAELETMLADGRLAAAWRSNEE